MDIKLIIKGFIVGIGKIIPGVSGSMLAISMGIYEKALQCISHFFRNIKENILFLGNLGLGLLLAVILFSHVIYWSLEKWYFYVMLLFIGLILGTMPAIFKNVQGKRIKIPQIVLFLLSSSLVFILTLLEQDNISTSQNSNIHFIIIGLIDAITMIVPGISGTAILMILGYYDLFINLFVEISMQSIIFFGIGLMVGVLLTSYIMGYFLSRYKIGTYYVILGLSISSIIILFLQTIQYPHTIFSFLIGIFLMMIGTIISSRLNKS